MRQVVRWLQGIDLRRVLAIACLTIALVVAPAFSFSQAIEAQANTRIIQAEPNGVDPLSDNTIKRVQRKAEDLGDGAKRDIGDTGLKNIRELPENIPETLDLVRKQRFGEGSQAEPETTKGIFGR
ncbi:MAG TPA: hypothetical protein V6D10_16860 [Trichocoleus sp.]|jgi:hypothetical protein